MNLVMGGNILWRLIPNEQEWWKIVLIKKYCDRSRKRCLDSPLARGKRISDLEALQGGGFFDLI